MTILILILILIAIIAVYPMIRDYVRRKKAPVASYTEGLSFLLDGRESDAIEKFKEAVSIDSNNVDAYLRLASLYYKQGEVERATKIYERLVLRRNITTEEEKKIYQNLADYYVKTDRIQRAITILEELIKLDRNNVNYYETLSSLYCKTERWQDCEELIKKLEKIQNNKEYIANYYVEFGKMLSVKNPEASAKYYKQALSFNRKSVPALIALGDYYYQKKETETAINIWKELLEYNPEFNYLVRNRLEAAYYDLGQYEEIVNLYDRLLKKVPEDSGLYFALAQIYEKKEDAHTAIRILNKIPSSGKKEVLPQIALAALYLQQGEVNRAKTILDNLMENLKR